MFMIKKTSLFNSQMDILWSAFSMSYRRCGMQNLHHDILDTVNCFIFVSTNFHQIWKKKTILSVHKFVISGLPWLPEHNCLSPKNNYDVFGALDRCDYLFDLSIITHNCGQSNEACDILVYHLEVINKDTRCYLDV